MKDKHLTELSVWIDTYLSYLCNVYTVSIYMSLKHRLINSGKLILTSVGFLLCPLWEQSSFRNQDL